MSLLDPQILISIGLAVTVIVIALVILGVMSRRVHYLMSELQAIRRDMGLIDEAVQTLTDSLTQRAKDRTGSQPSLDG